MFDIVSVYIVHGECIRKYIFLECSIIGFFITNPSTTIATRIYRVSMAGLS